MLLVAKHLTDTDGVPSLPSEGQGGQASQSYWEMNRILKAKDRRARGRAA